MRQQTNLIIRLRNDVIVAQDTNTTALTNAGIMIGYNEPCNSIGGADNFAVFDDICAETAVPDYESNGLPDQRE